MKAEKPLVRYLKKKQMQMMIQVGGGRMKAFAISVLFFHMHIGILAAQEKVIDSKIEIEVLSESRTNINSQFWIDDMEIGESTRGIDGKVPFYSVFRGKGKQGSAVTAVNSERITGFIILAESRFHMELQNRRPRKISIDAGYHITLTDSNEYIPVIGDGARNHSEHGGLNRLSQEKLDEIEWRRVKPANPRDAIGKLVAETLVGGSKWKQYRLLDEGARQVLVCITDGQFSKISRTTKNKAIEFEFIDADSDSRLDFLRIECHSEGKPKIRFLVVQDSGLLSSMPVEMSVLFSKLGEDKFLEQWRENALNAPNKPKVD